MLMPTGPTTGRHLPDQGELWPVVDSAGSATGPCRLTARATSFAGGQLLCGTQVNRRVGAVHSLSCLRFGG